MQATKPRRQPQRRRPRHQLTRTLIVDTAIELIERGGPSALSMRRLGSALGVEAMALYHHFRDRDDLLQAITDRIIEPMGDPVLPDEWRAACRTFAMRLRKIAVARPATFQLVGLHPFDTSSALGPVEQLLEVLVAEGFTPASALVIYRSVGSYARGYALAEATGFTVDASNSEGRRHLMTLPEDEFPILAGRADELIDVEAGAAYMLGLDALLDGLAGLR